MRRLKRIRHTHLLAVGFVTVAGLGIASALLNGTTETGSAASTAYDSGATLTDPLPFDPTNLGAQVYSTGAADSIPVTSETSDVQAIVPPANIDSVGSNLISSDSPAFVVADPARIAAFNVESDYRGGAFRPGQPAPTSTSSPSASGRASPYAAGGGGSFGGGGGSGFGGMPSADAGGQLGSGVANSTSGDGSGSTALAMGGRANGPPSFAEGASSFAPGLSLAPGLSFATGSSVVQSVPVGSGPTNSLLASNSAGPAGASAQTLQPVQVPEPSTLILLGAGLAFMARRRRR